MLNFYNLLPAKGGKPGYAVILLHGLGDSGRGGLLSIGGLWQNEFPDTEFICPDAPFAFDMAPPELCDNGRQWFSLKDFSPSAMLRGAQMAAPYLNDFIDNILATRELTPGKIALVGFSQGTMMALFVALRRHDPIAGIVGYSGMLAGGELLAKEKRSAPPVLLIHGTADEVVPYAVLAESERVLKYNNVPVSSLTRRGLGHGIDDEGLGAGLKFLKQVLV
jgi:phospholipase/carboxylesterase